VFVHSLGGMNHSCSPRPDFHFERSFRLLQSFGLDSPTLKEPVKMEYLFLNQKNVVFLRDMSLIHFALDNNTTY